MNGFNFDTRALFRNGMLVLLLVFIALVVHNIFGQNGYLAARRQQQDLQTLQQRIQELRQENQQLNKENRALKSDPNSIERIAREQMRLVKPGEKIYTLPDKDGQKPSDPGSKTPAAAYP